MLNLYCTLEETRARTGIDALTDDDNILDTIDRASRYLEQQTGRYFYPHIATKYFDWQGDKAISLLDNDLLSLTTLTTNNGATAISTGYYLVRVGDYNNAPYDTILLDQSLTTKFLYTLTPQKSQTVVGVYGYHEDYSNAWAASGQTVLNVGGITASGTSITVTNGAAFEVGQTLQIQTEWLYLSAISGNTLTVTRGVNGSTAATHAAATAISIFQYDINLHRAAIQLAAWLYKQYEAPFTGQTQTGADGTVDIPGGVPVAVAEFITNYQTKSKARHKWQIFQ